LQLDPQILVEYIYTDPLSPEIIETDANGAKILILENPYVGANHLFSEDNPFVVTGNLRTRSVLPLNSARTQYAYLTTSNVLNYLDFDNSLDSVNDLLGQLTTLPNVPTKAPHYDTIRIHMVSGYSFEGLGDGYIFEALVSDRNSNKNSVASIVYRPSDNYEILNPTPFILGEKLYTKYIEIKVPATSWMTDEYLLDKTDSSNLSWLFTSGNGLKVQNTIELSIKYIVKTEKINGQTYFYPGETSKASVNIRDEYSNLYAVVEESTVGDYFELYGEYAGDIYEDFILQLNNEPDTDIVALHDIQVLEQVGTSFVKTSEQSFIQSDDFGVPYRFRPIIINSHIATSYRIIYTLRILNKVDNSQIIRNVQYSSFDVKKYGRKFRKLNLGTVPNITKVYNTVPSETQNIILNNDVNFNISTEGGATIIKQTEFVLGFKESVKVSASTSNVKTTPAVLQEGDIVPTAEGSTIMVGDVPLDIVSITPTNKIYPQNNASITVSPFDNFVKFIFYDNSLQEATGATDPQLLDLSSVGTLFLSFFNSETNDEVRVSNYTNISGINPAQGEVVFKITKEESKKVLGFTSNIFYVSSRLEVGQSKSDETLLYTGKWFKPQDLYQQTASEVVEELKNTIKNLNLQLNAEKAAANQIITNQQISIDNLTSENSTLQQNITESANTVVNVPTVTDNTVSVINTPTPTTTSNTSTSTSNTSTSTSNQNTKTKASLFDKIKKGKEMYISPKEYEKLKGINVKKIKFNP
jgi:hypothetical protein